MGEAFPTKLIGDQLRLQQVLTNLVGNALKFTSQGEIVLNMTLLAINNAELSILFSVIDTGIGIAAADQHKLFKSFSQVDSSNTRKFGGTGLGLAISQKLVTLMGSQLDVASIEGLGSTFSFVLNMPRAMPSVQHALAQTIEPIAQPLLPETAFLRDKRILLADDNVAIQELIRDYLQMFGVLIDIANNGKDALTQLQQQPYDLVIMDVRMPVLSGIEATTQLRADARFANLPIIGCTAGATDEERERCLACGMSDLLLKPFELTKLSVLLDKWLQD